MDGNGRWANQRGLARTKGHEAGEAALLDVVAGAIEVGVTHLSAYAFSTENWKRSPDEVRFLMGFNRDVIRRRRDQLHAWGVRMRWVGPPAAAVGLGHQGARGRAGADEGQHGPHPLLLRQLRRAGRDRRCRPAPRRGRRARPPQAEERRRAHRGSLPPRARHARRRPLRPVLRRAADEQLPPVAERLRRDGLPGPALARLRPARPLGRRAVLRRPRASLRRGRRRRRRLEKPATWARSASRPRTTRRR